MSIPLFYGSATILRKNRTMSETSYRYGRGANRFATRNPARPVRLVGDYGADDPAAQISHAAYLSVGNSA